MFNSQPELLETHGRESYFTRRKIRHNTDMNFKDIYYLFFCKFPNRVRVALESNQKYRRRDLVVHRDQRTRLRSGTWSPSTPFLPRAS